MSDPLRASIIKFIDQALREPLRLLGLYVEGVEVTQAIQYWHAADHLTDPADRGPDNSIRLVADKPAYVRVYVRSQRGSLPGVIGSVTVQRLRAGLWTDSGTLAQQPPASITAESAPGYAAERGSLNSSLNFLIPAALMRGPMRLKVHVEVPGTKNRSDTELDLDVSLLQTLRVRGIPVQYWGPYAAGNQVQLPAPSLAEFQSTAATALLMFPVSQTPDITLAGTFTWSQPLTGNITTNGVSASCPTSWNNLLTWLGAAKILDGNKPDRLYYALLPNGIPLGDAAGCGGGGTVGAGFSGVTSTMAHELGHVLSFGHAPCGLRTGDMGDPNYPAYEPYDTVANRQASIGEYGMDPTTATVYSPNFTADFMSYCGANWISLYHYRALLQHPLLDPQWVPPPGGSLPPYYDEYFRDIIPHHIPDPPPPWVGRRIRQLRDPEAVPVVVIIGLLEQDRLDIRHVLRLSTVPVTSGGQVRDTAVELLDANQQVLHRAPLLRVGLHPCGCGCSGGANGDGPATGLVQAILPENESIDSIRIIRGETELWSRQRTSGPPRISEVTAEIEEENLRVQWQAYVCDQSVVQRAVRWSRDEARTWEALAVGVMEDAVLVPVGSLASGPALIQVLVSDGFHTAISESVAVEIPARPPQVAILWPIQGGAVQTGKRLRLWGTATASDGRALPADALRWELDGEPAGAGPESWTELPEWDGEHLATLRVQDGNDVAQATVTFFATCTGHRPRGLRRE